MSRVTRTSKAYPGIKVSTDATDGQPKPYEGYRRGKGMPSAHEPIESMSEQGRKNLDKIYGHTNNKLIPNAKIKKTCGDTGCECYSERKSSHCSRYFDIKKCRGKNE